MKKAGIVLTCIGGCCLLYVLAIWGSWWAVLWIFISGLFLVPGIPLWITGHNADKTQTKTNNFIPPVPVNMEPQPLEPNIAVMPLKKEEFEFKVAGVTFSDNGVSRQSILKKIKQIVSPFDKEIRIAFTKFDYEGEIAVAVSFNGFRVGNVPKTDLDELLQNWIYIESVDEFAVYGGGDNGFGEEKNYGARIGYTCDRNNVLRPSDSNEIVYEFKPHYSYEEMLGSKIPRKSFLLTGSNEEMQYHRCSISEGEQLDCQYDSYNDRYEVSCMFGDVGYLPKTNGKLIDDYDCTIFVEDIEYRDNDKIAVRVCLFYQE